MPSPICLTQSPLDLLALAAAALNQVPVPFIPATPGITSDVPPADDWHNFLVAAAPSETPEPAAPAVSDDASPHVIHRAIGFDSSDQSVGASTAPDVAGARRVAGDVRSGGRARGLVR